MAFDPDAPVADPWTPFGRYAFWVPRYELLREDQTWFLALNGAAGDLPERLANDRILADAPADPPALPTGRVLSVEPQEATWHTHVTGLTASFGEALAKLVLASRCQVRLTGATDPCTLLHQLRGNRQGSYDFIFQTGARSFLGRSPECLYRRDGDRVATEALAGTGAGEAGLRDSAKEIREHDYVVKDIEAALQTVCRDVQAARGPELVSWGALQHLCTRFQATLETGADDGALLRALHPSAAVLGYPRPEARRRLAAYEPFSRGWYAGPVGWIGRDAAEFAVAIRSALLRDRDLAVYAGAGIVQGSQPAREWQELQDKMRPFFQALRIDS
jgi:menaquinone-specific isochorismate synthase